MHKYMDLHCLITTKYSKVYNTLDFSCLNFKLGYLFVDDKLILQFSFLEQLVLIPETNRKIQGETFICANKDIIHIVLTQIRTSCTGAHPCFIVKDLLTSSWCLPPTPGP